MTEVVTIPLEMLEALCHDANWRTEKFGDTIRVYHRFYGNDYYIMEEDV